MSDRLEAIIDARDNASPKFRQVSDSAKQLDTQLDNTGRSAERFSRAGAAMGAALGSLAGLLGDAARAAGEAEVSQARLETAIEATGELYEVYADQLEAAGEAAVQMGFDDEAAADSISALTAVTNDASVAIERQGLVMDIARGRGIDLAAATKIVVAAENERFGALARIGIVLDDNATKEEAIAALQQKYAGQAQAYAETQIGALDELNQMYENGMEAVGGYAGEAQLLLMLLPGLSAGFTAVAAAVGGLSASLASGTLARFAGGAFLGGAGIAAGGILGGLGLVGYMLAHPEETGIGEDLPYLEQYQITLEGLEQTLLRTSNTGNQAAIETGQQSATIISDLTSVAERYQALWFQIEHAADGVDTSTWMHEIASIEEEFGKGFAQNGVSYLNEIAQDVNAIMGYTGEGAALAQEDLARLNDEFARTGDVNRYHSELDILANTLATYDAEAAAGVETTRQLNDELYESLGSQETYNDLLRARAIYAKEVADAQAELTASFNAQQVAITQNRDALDDVFRVFVGNTGAIANQAQDVADWSTGLLEAGLSAENYGTALESNNRILAANASIQADILSIQAQTSPIVATATERLAEQIDVLEGADTDAQLFALGMMDAATASQALGLAQSYLADQDTFGPMLQQAAELNPALAQILEEMGLISYNPATGEVRLLGVEESKSDLEALNETLQRVAYTNILISVDYDKEQAEEDFRDLFGYGPGDIGEPIPVDVPVDPNFLLPDGALPTFDIETGEPIPIDVPVEPTYTEADGGVTTFYPTVVPEAEPVDVDVPVNPVWVWQDAAAGDGTGGPSPGGDMAPIVVPVEADTSGFMSGIGDAEATATEFSGQTYSPDIGIVTNDFDSGASAVTQTLGDLDSTTSTPSIGVDDNATSTLYNISSLLNSLDGRSVTSYATVIQQTIGGGAIFAHGGVASFADGGVAEMGEYGDEIVRFADGGVGRTRGRGIYGLPNGAYTTPAPASIEPLRRGGHTFVFNIAGSVVTERELAAVVAEAIGPVLLDVLDDSEMRAER
jgi:hypothetical protein